MVYLWEFKVGPPFVPRTGNASNGARAGPPQLERRYARSLAATRRRLFLARLFPNFVVFYIPVIVSCNTPPL
jgi:hypothetical protein